MNSKAICPSKLNSLVANDKATAALTRFEEKNPDCLAGVTIEQKVRLVQLVLRVAVFKHVIGKPFYAFIKQAGPMAAVVDIESGAVAVFDNSIIASETGVSGKFKIDGVTYAKKDTVNGFNRYAVVLAKKNRVRKNKMDLNSSEITTAVKEAKQMAKERMIAGWLHD